MAVRHRGISSPCRSTQHQVSSDVPHLLQRKARLRVKHFHQGEEARGGMEERELDAEVVEDEGGKKRSNEEEEEEEEEKVDRLACSATTPWSTIIISVLTGCTSPSSSRRSGLRRMPSCVRSSRWRRRDECVRGVTSSLDQAKSDGVKGNFLPHGCCFLIAVAMFADISVLRPQVRRCPVLAGKCVCIGEDHGEPYPSPNYANQKKKPLLRVRATPSSLLLPSLPLPSRPVPYLRSVPLFSFPPLFYALSLLPAVHNLAPPCPILLLPPLLTPDDLFQSVVCEPTAVDGILSRMEFTFGKSGKVET
eukprot:751488-Hanusia_phi.AAC.5